MRRFRWDDLPDFAREAVRERCGNVLKAESAEHGTMPGVAARLYIEDGTSVFLKGIPCDARAASLYERECAANLALTDTVPSPRMLWSIEAGGWLLSMFEFVHDARHADLSPRSPDLPGVLDALALPGSPSGAVPPIAVNLEMPQEKTAALLAEGLAGRHWTMYRESLDAFSIAALDGDALVHYDVHAPNILISGTATYLIDWSFACHGAAWVDAALLVPRLIEAGHTPAQAEELVTALPAWNAAPADAVTGLAALWTMFREYKALYGPEKSRASRRKAAHAGRAWIAHRTGRAPDGLAPDHVRRARRAARVVPARGAPPGDMRRLWHRGGDFAHGQVGRR